MFLVSCICTDEACAEETEVVVSHELAAVDAHACGDCGCALATLAVSEWERAEARVPALLAA